MTLEPHETRSALWQRLHAHLTERLDALRRSNDGDMSMEETQRLRGRIAQLKEILALGREPVQVGLDAPSAQPDTGPYGLFLEE